MSYYCKVCGLQSMNEPFEDNLCDDCWTKSRRQKNEDIVSWSHDTEKTAEQNKQDNKWHAFQSFQHILDLGDMKKIRRHLIAIEKALFWKGGVK